MVVEIPVRVREQCEDLGAGVAYALKVLCRQLEHDPLLGEAGGGPSLRVAQIDGSAFEDCPSLSVQYAYGPPLLEEGQLQIKCIEEVQSVEPDEDEEELAPAPRTDALQARQVADAWQRTEAWLREYAPASYAALRSGASDDEIAALEEALDAVVPEALKQLWRLRAGVEGTGLSGGFLLGNWALMPLEGVSQLYQRNMLSQRHEEMLSQRRENGEEITVWKPSWIPFCSWNVEDWSYGLYLDACTGEVWQWTESADRSLEYPSLTDYLEEMVDVLEAPSFVDYPKPGLINGCLRWGPPSDPDEEAMWEPLSG